MMVELGSDSVSENQVDLLEIEKQHLRNVSNKPIKKEISADFVLSIKENFPTFLHRILNKCDTV